MKTKHILFSLLMMAGLTDCNDKLEETVYSNLTDETAFTTGENAQAAVNSMYSPLHLIYRTPMFYINDMSTDDCYNNGWVFEVMNDEGISTRDELAAAWDGFYQIASRANIVLDNIPEMHDGVFGKDYSKTQMIAEAHFMRAFAYYNLTDIFYQVPLVTSSKVNVADRLPYDDIDVIEERIEADLNAAVNDLPRYYASNAEAGRPTYGAACSMLCRLYMREAGRCRQNGNEQVAQQKWALACEQADKVLALEGSVYNLQPKVWNVFDPSSDATIYNDELIFAVRASGTITSGSWDLGMMFTDWEYDMGWNLFQLPLEMVWQFDRADQRFTQLMVTEYKDIYKPQETYFTMPPSIDKTGTMSSNQVINGHTYITVNENNCAFTQKYKFLNTWKYIYDTPNNMPILRLADIILCKAEILNEINGPSQESLTLINRIRERAFGDTSHNLNLADYPTKDALRSAICDERLYELNNECVRRPDLIRMGLWKDRMDKYIAGIKTKIEWKEKNEGKTPGFYKEQYVSYLTDLKANDIRRYMPIPKRETDNNANLLEARSFK